NFQTFYISYTSANSLQQGTIEFSHNAPGSPSILNVSSVNLQSQFSIYPASIYFYSQPLSKRVWITNTGNFDTLIVTDIISSNSNYTITPNAFPVMIPPGSTKIFYIALNNSPGFQFGTIEFFHNTAGLQSKIFVSNQLISPQFEGLIVVQSGSASKSLKFGLDSLATDGIDEIFEENEIPPLPPPGAFDARFILPKNNYSGSLNSYNDFRFGCIPFSQQKEFRLHYQQYYNNGIEISWYLPHSITGVLQDLYNGTFINKPMADSGSFTVTNPDLFSRLRMLIDFNITTPVELVSFDATLLDNSVRLDWTTATETNNSGFEILRQAQNDNEWNTIGFFPGFGTTTEPKSYSFTDEDVTTGKYKYRLKQIDYDGSFTYSDEIEVEVDFTPKEFVLYQNYPNPFNPNTVIKFAIPKEAHVNISVYNLLGEKAREIKNEIMQPGNYSIEFDASMLASAMYLYRIQTGEFVQIKKMILTK
ncbi:MAG: T9SS type A sorting domain-containing protein, partial [Ignavibacteria bacterium]|nr:T9SS type A sorting domain-containing protein [Ignavibacteria bacterium]